MNYITIIFVLLLLLGTSDLITEKYPKLQADIYNCAFFVTVFLFLIKYYFGPDIVHYVPHYYGMTSVSEVLLMNYSNNFEWGYNLFCSILNSMNVSFYWMTVLVDLIYFYVIYLLFNQIKNKRTFALMVLVLFEYNLIFFEYRQCLSVSFFLLMTICMQRENKVGMIICALLSIICHKAGIFVVGLTLFFFLIHGKKIRPLVYQILFWVLVLMMLLPITKISVFFLHLLPLPESYLISLEHHLSLGRQFQLIFFIYALTILCIEYYISCQKNNINTFAIVSIVAICIIISLYQYYYLLNRIRSYFLPILIVYIFNLIQNNSTIRYGTLIRQSLCIVVIIFFLHQINLIENGMSKMKNKEINTPCTIFNLINHDKNQIQNRQLQIADRWWVEDYLEDENNVIKKK